jgi:acyl transferase domain-containing protein
MNPDQLASFLQKATSTPQNVPKNPTQSTPQPQKQNMSQFLEKYQKVLPPNDFNDLKSLAISLQKQEISKPEFESGFQQILLKNQAPNTNVQNQTVETQTPISTEMKQLITLYSRSTKDEKHLILKKHPELVPVLKQMVEQKRSQVAPPGIQPTQNAPIIQQIPKTQQPPPQTFPQFQPLKQTFQPPVQAIPKPQIKNPQMPPQTLPQTFIQKPTLQKPNIDLKLEKSTASAPPPQKKQKIENKKPPKPKEEEAVDIDSLNDVTKIAGVNLEKEESSWFEDEEVSEKYTLQRLPDFLNRGPLTNKIQLKANQMKIQEISDDVYECVSLSVNERMYHIIEALIKISNHRQVKHTSKTNVSNKERKLHETISSLTESVKLIENEDKMDKKKPAKKVEKKDEDDEDYKTSSANLAAEMAIMGDFGNSNKKRKMNFEQKSNSLTMNTETQMESHTGPKVVVEKKKSTIVLEDILFHMEKEEKLKKSKLLHGIYLKRK